MDVKVAALKEFESAPGTLVSPGQVLDVLEPTARRWVEDGLCAYYSQFNQSMLRNRESIQTRTAEAPEKAIKRR